MKQYKIHIDFETRSHLDLKKYGAWEYSRHPSTGIICMGYKTEAMKTAEIWIPGQKSPLVFLKPNVLIIAQNALFEYAIYANICIEKHKFPKRVLSVKHWACTQSMSLSVGLPGGLADCGKALNLDITKLNTGKALIQKYCLPIKDRETKELTFREMTLEDREAMYEYCRMDVESAAACYQKIYRLPNIELERAIYELDLFQNIQGLPVDMDAVKYIAGIIDEAKAQAEKEMAELGVNVRSVPQMKKLFADQGELLPNLQIETVEVAYNTTKNPFLKQVLILRMFLSKASVKKYDALINRTGPDNYIRYALKYFGAHTGRWSGKGFQPHNMPRTKTTVDIIEATIKTFSADDSRETIIEKAKIMLPGMIKPIKGYVFLLGDFSAIEAMAIALLAGEKKLIKLFRGGGDPYKYMGSLIYKIPISKIQKESIERQLGKQAVLGCGYSMAWERFLNTCAKYGIIISEELAQHTVKTYREAYPKIVSFWYALEAAFKKASATKSNSPIIQVGEYIKMWGKNSYVAVQLPSGRILYYHRVKVTRNDITYHSFSRKTKVHIYGGMMAENITQAICRDLLVSCMLECHTQNLNPFLHVHDEIVCSVEEKTVDRDMEKFKTIMNSPPDWFKDLPLKTEVEICTRYHK